jgi:membrane peptidoglycan carboxypeptidase
VHHASQPKTVVVQQPAYYYQATPPPPAPAPAPDSTKSPESRLEELKSMYDKGLITKSEYDKKKSQILDQM